MSHVLVDENGFARGIRYHDGNLDGVLVDSKMKTAHFAISAVSGERRILSLHGVIALDLSEFRQGNILADIRILPACQALEDAEVTIQIEKRLYFTREKVPIGALVFWLDSSYGAEAFAICDRVEVSDTETWLTLTSGNFSR